MNSLESKVVTATKWSALKKINTMKKQAITLNERKKILLEMLKEIDAFCRANDIRYSLAFGTLLGAIRHKGFIPWDDDMDIMMPLPDLLKFKELFHSDKLKYCDVDTEKHYDFPFSRIAYKPTYRQQGLIFQSYGVCIDLLPVISIPSDENKQNDFFSLVIKLRKKRKLAKKWRDRIIKYLPLRTIPLYDYIQKRYRNSILDSMKYNPSGEYYVVAIPPENRKRVMHNIDLFEILIDVDFEKFKFLATIYFDVFLTKMYGDYMRLPSETERHPHHSNKYFWKCNI